MNTLETYFYYGDPETKITASSNTVAECTGQNTDFADPNKALKVKGIDITGKVPGTYSRIVEFTVSVQ